jgi:hypothetical protein
MVVQHLAARIDVILHSSERSRANPFVSEADGCDEELAVPSLRRRLVQLVFNSLPQSRLGHLAASGVAAVLALTPLPVVRGVDAASTNMNAAAFVVAVEAGRAADLTDVVVEGDVDLSSLETVSDPVRCRQCRFTGSVRAVDVVYDGLVDLTNARIAGNLDVHGSTFSGPFIADGSGQQPTCLGGRAIFTLTTFKDVASFDGASFAGPADFAMARFDGAASFADTGFRDVADFRRTTFAGTARFSSSPGPPPTSGCVDARLGVFAHDAVFTRAVFGSSADFSRRRFEGRAAFDDATFAESADFSAAVFTLDAIFRAAAFGRVNARLAKFGGDADFSYSTIRESASFDYAWLYSTLLLRELVSQGTVSLRPIRAIEVIGRRRPRLDLVDSSIGSLRMDVDLVRFVAGPDEQSRILALIEQSAKNRDDLSAANEARFERLALENEQRGSDLWAGFHLKPWESIHGEGLHRLADAYGYQLVGGYLVRPTHPLVALLLLLGLGALVRSLGPVLPRLRRGLRAFAGWTWHRWYAGILQHGISIVSQIPGILRRCLTTLIHNFGVSLGIAVSKKPSGLDGKSDGHVAVVWIESLTYKVLLALALIGLANASPTLRQIIDTAMQR